MIRLDDKPTIANEQGAQIRQSLGYEVADARRMDIDRIRPFRQGLIGKGRVSTAVAACRCSPLEFLRMIPSPLPRKAIWPSIVTLS